MPRYLGKSRTRRTRRLGMQAQIMPTFISIVDHWDTGRLSQVGLLELAKWTRDCRRRMLTIVTLRAY